MVIIRCIVLLLTALFADACTDAGERARRPKRVICNNPAPSADDVEILRWRLDQARRALPGMTPVDRAQMAMRIEYAQEAVNRFEVALGNDNWCTKGKGFLFTAGAVAVGDDASVVGVADDVVLPFIVIGLMATHLMTQAPAPPAELAQAWTGVIGSLDAVRQAAERMKTSPLLPPEHDCQVHFAECLMTPLGNKNSGGSWGHSICSDCERLCRGQGKWPSHTGYGKSCEWWRL